MAAAYLFHIASNHPSEDGNKRTAMHSALVFLELNGVQTNVPVDEADALAVGIASHVASRDDAIRFFQRLNDGA